MIKISRLAVGAAALGAALGLFLPASSHAATVVVNTISLNGWAFFNEGPVDTVGVVTLTPGPGIAPLGIGSATLQVDDLGRASFGTFTYKGTLLSSITELTYHSYPSSALHVAELALQFDVDYDATDANTAYQGRLSYIPPGSPTSDTWVAHDALAGTWSASQPPGNAFCTQTTPCTWAEILSHFPNAAIRNDPTQFGALIFRLGGPITGGAVTSVDDFTITVNGTPTTFDFEPGATANPPIGSAGTIVVLQAYGFKPGANVTAYYYTNVTPRQRVRMCQAPAWNGAFYCAVPIPSAPTAGPSGVHNIRVSGRSAAARKTLIYNTGFALP